MKQKIILYLCLILIFRVNVTAQINQSDTENQSHIEVDTIRKNEKCFITHINHRPFNPKEGYNNQVQVLTNANTFNPYEGYVNVNTGQPVVNAEADKRRREENARIKREQEAKQNYEVQRKLMKNINYSITSVQHDKAIIMIKEEMLQKYCSTYTIFWKEDNVDEKCWNKMDVHSIGNEKPIIIKNLKSEAGYHIYITSNCFPSIDTRLEKRGYFVTKTECPDFPSIDDLKITVYKFSKKAKIRINYYNSFDYIFKDGEAAKFPSVGEELKVKNIEYGNGEEACQFFIQQIELEDENGNSYQYTKNK